MRWILPAVICFAVAAYVLSQTNHCDGKGTRIAGVMLIEGCP